MSPTYKGRKTPGSIIAKPLTFGCSWCINERDPQYTTELLDIIFAGRQLARYGGDGICQTCVSYFKNALCSPRWQQARKHHLACTPYCADCQSRGAVEVATVIDHVVPWRFAPSLFWDVDNWQQLCRQCHDVKSNLERS